MKKRKGKVPIHKRHFHHSHFFIFLAILLAAILIVAFYNSYEAPQTLYVSAERPSPSPSPIMRVAAREEITHIDRTKKQVSFTFDGGSGDGSTKEILEALLKHGVKGTFFFTGKWIEENPDWTRRIVAEGHEIFNHSYSHPYFTQISDEKIVEELQKMDDLLFQTTGVRTKPYYRAPYGDRNSHVNDVAYAAGYQHIYWSVDSLDWRPGETPETIKNRVLPNIHPGAIILMHVGNPSTGLIIDEIFTILENQGYELVSLTEGLQ